MAAHIWLISSKYSSGGSSEQMRTEFCRSATMTAPSVSAGRRWWWVWGGGQTPPGAASRRAEQPAVAGVLVGVDHQDAFTEAGGVNAVVFLVAIGGAQVERQFCHRAGRSE